MRHKSGTRGTGSEKLVRTIRRKTRRQYSAEEKIRIVLDGLRGEDSIAELCCREGISQGVYYKWSKDFMETGKRRRSYGGGYARGQQVYVACYGGGWET